MASTRSTFYSFVLATCILTCAPLQAYAQRLTSTCSLQELTDFANRNIHSAQCQLGRRYYEGSGGAPRDARTAIKWFQAAGENGSIVARLYLSVCYKDGDGAEKDENFATKLSDHYLNFFHKDLKTRADHGDAEAKLELDGITHLEIGRIYYRRGTMGSPSHLAKAFQEFKQAAQSGNAESLLYVCVCYLDGSGVAWDEKQASEYFTQYQKRLHPELLDRANMGDANAKEKVDTIYNYRLGLIYWDHGDSWWLERRKKAIRHLEASAARNDAQSFAIPATCHTEGFGVPKDEAKAASLSKKWNEAMEAESTAREQTVLNLCDTFVAAHRQVTTNDIKSSADRWKLIDPLNKFRLPQGEADGKSLSEKIKSVEEDVRSLEVVRQELEEYQRFTERVARSGARLSEEGIRKKITLEDCHSRITGRISLALDGIADNDFLKRIAKETKILPGEQRSRNAASVHGIYSFEHIEAILWQSRRYGLVANKTLNTDDFRQILSKIKYVGANNGLACDTNSERLLVAGLLMHEVSRIIDDKKRLQLTQSDKTHLNDLLSDYRYVLEHAATEHAEGSGDKNRRAKETTAALAFSWNACRALIGN